MQESSRGALEKAVILLRERSGNVFPHYKRSTLYRRIERRMGIHQIDRIDDYIRYPRENPQLLDQLFKELLIGGDELLPRRGRGQKHTGPAHRKVHHEKKDFHNSR